jgi:hypothetical protein
MPTKSYSLLRNGRIRWRYAPFLALCAAVFTLSAAETNSPPANPPAMTPEQMFEGGTNTYTNWIEFSTGGFFTTGNTAQFQQQQRTSGGAFGGIQDFHYQDNLNKTTTLTMDGHAIFDLHDYKLRLNLEREKVGYLRLSYNQFRTWENADGGNFPPSGAFYSKAGNALTLDRGQILFEGGWTPEKGPQVTFKYAHTFREGDEASTSWGYTHPASSALTRGLSPSFEDIHEHSDSFQLDLTDHVKSTDLGAGLRYETAKLDDALMVTQFPGEPVQQEITSRQGTTYDLFDVHAFSETWVKTNFMLSSGFSYSDLDNNFSGSRIYGNDFDVGYVPSAQNSFGYLDLYGGSRLDEYVADLNLFYKPAPHFNITPSLRAQKEDWNANSGGLETLAANAAVPFTSDSSRGLLQMTERLDLLYNGITNWVLYARSEFTEESGNLNENGGLVPVGGIGVPPILTHTDDNTFFQKYSAGARWYPARGVTLDAGGYYKIDDYHYANSVGAILPDNTLGYPAYLMMQDFRTYDGNVRLTLRPWHNVTAISRYEFQLSTTQTTPDAITGLASVESSRMTSHIIAQDVSWVPWSRLSLQAGVNYVLSETTTPASDVTQAILNSQNNYWTLNFSSDLVLDDKTDLRVSYFYYQADDYVNNSLAGVPYGAGGQEHSITAILTRRISKNIRLSLKYGYFHYDDALYGGNENFGAHLIYASLRYRF